MSFVVVLAALCRDELCRNELCRNELSLRLVLTDPPMRILILIPFASALPPL